MVHGGGVAVDRQGLGAGDAVDGGALVDEGFEDVVVEVGGEGFSQGFAPFGL